MRNVEDKTSETREQSLQQRFQFAVGFDTSAATLTHAVAHSGRQDISVELAAELMIWIGVRHIADREAGAPKKHGVHARALRMIREGKDPK